MQKTVYGINVKITYTFPAWEQLTLDNMVNFHFYNILKSLVAVTSETWYYSFEGTN